MRLTTTSKKADEPLELPFAKLAQAFILCMLFTGACLLFKTVCNVGNATSSTDPLGNVTAQSYDALNRVTQVTFADSKTNQFSYTATGLKCKAVDEKGVVTQMEYDFAGRPIESIADAGTGKLNATTQSVYDMDGNVTATINPLGFEWDYTYDRRNRKIVEFDPAVVDATTGATRRPEKTWEYDNVGNVLAVMDPRLHRTDTVYDAANRAVQVTQPADATGTRPVTTSQYDANGNVTQMTDPDGHTTTNTYDVLNRLTSTEDAASITVGYAYDDVGNRLSVTDGLGNVTHFTYDGLKRNLTITDSGSNTTAFAYDALNKTGRTDALSQVTGYSYDVRNRLTGVSYASRTADNRTYSYDDVGNLLSVTQSGTNNPANVAYTYDNLRRAVTETSGGLQHSYTYDVAGNRLQTVYGGTSRTILSTYDALNRLATMTENSRTTSYGYDLNGNDVLKTLPNGDTITSTYDALNRALSIDGKTGAAAALYHYATTYDLAGNVLSVVETYPSGLSSRTVTNTYDTIYRLLTEGDTISGTTTTTTYTYDAANNRASKVIGSGTTGYTYNAINQLTAISGTESKTFTYDANGNRATEATTTGTDTYSYDYENRLVGLVKNIAGSGIHTGTYAYAYDYRTRRVTRDESATTGGVATKVIYSGGTSVEELSGTATTPTVEYIRGSDYGGGVGGVLYTLRGGTPSYTHENRRGDVVAKTDGSGSLTYQAAYEAFGKRTQENGSTLDRQKANTKDEDPTGLSNEGFRYKKDFVFITKDPAGFVDGPNLYTYVKQNPWTGFDPEGLADNNDPNRATLFDILAPVTSASFRKTPGPWGGVAGAIRHDHEEYEPLAKMTAIAYGGEAVLLGGGPLLAMISPEAVYITATRLAYNQAAHATAAALIMAGVVYHDTGSISDAATTALFMGMQSYADGAFNRGTVVGNKTALETNSEAAGKATADGPSEPYSRSMYGKTPTAADRKEFGAAPDEVVDHQPELVKRYYEGDPATNEKPGYQMTPEEKKSSANDRSRMQLQQRSESNSQGGKAANYSKQKKKELGF